MRSIQIIALGCFINGAAHYVRDGQSFWYAAWMLIGVLLVWLDGRVREKALPSRQQEGSK